MNSLLTELNSTFGFTAEQIKRGIACRVDGVDAEALDINKWIQSDGSMPSWAKRAAASWVIELWMNERDACEPTELLKVDNRYSRILKDFSMADIIAMRNSIGVPK
ncbi:hypothetical protein [Kaarinaea lacus]